MKPACLEHLECTMQSHFICMERLSQYRKPLYRDTLRTRQCVQKPNQKQVKKIEAHKENW